MLSLELVFAQHWGKAYKTFYSRNLRIFGNKLECLSLASSYQPNLMFTERSEPARVKQLSGAPL
jgi:hypothetical protein